MPHDKNGNVLKVGDSVIIRGKIAQITQDGDMFCNLNVETEENMYPGDNKTSVALNARQVEKVERHDPEGKKVEMPSHGPGGFF